MIKECQCSSCITAREQARACEQAKQAREQYIAALEVEHAVAIVYLQKLMPSSYDRWSAAHRVAEALKPKEPK